MQVVLHIKNETRGAKALLSLSDRGPRRESDGTVQVPILAAGRVETVSYACSAGRRGVYRFGSCAVESSSPFGLVNARRLVESGSDLVVYPLYYDLAGAMFPLRKSYSGMTSAPGSRPGDGASFFGLREYRHGDPIRKIHWPSSIRARTIMVKEFEEDVHSSVAILLDTSRVSVVTVAGDTNLEVAIRVAASLANHTLVNGHPAALVYFDEATKAVRTDRALGDFTPILDGLARLTPSSMKPADLVAASAALPRHTNLIVVLLSPDRDAMEQILRQRSQGNEIMVVIVDKYGARARTEDPQWLTAMFGMFDNAGIGTVLIAPGDDIRACLLRNARPPTVTGR